jgi:hypothetical protein
MSRHSHYLHTLESPSQFPSYLPTSSASNSTASLLAPNSAGFLGAPHTSCLWTSESCISARVSMGPCFCSPYRSSASRPLLLFFLRRHSRNATMAPMSMMAPSTAPTIAPMDVLLGGGVAGADEGDEDDDDDDDVNFKLCSAARAMGKVVVADGLAARREEYVSFMRVAFKRATGFSAVAQQIFILPVGMSC